MISFLTWYVLITLLGWLAFPVTFRLLPKLFDRGYSLARAVGLLIWGYVFWLLASLHILQNDSGGELVALIILGGFSLWILRGSGWQEMREWLRTKRRVIVATEGIFLFFFAAWAVVRAANPDIIGTEKPMELAFINSILRSPTFPPNDPWLSGYAISYYYFGYVMIAMITRLSGVMTSVAFNLASALWYSLTAIGAYGIIYSLLSLWNQHRASTATGSSASSVKKRGLPASFFALLGPAFILIISNIEGFLEMLHARGLFWTQNPDGTWVSPFWRWLDIQEITQPPSLPLSWFPTRVGGIWWWRASRVLQDYDFAHNSKEIIDEFPFFSYLLSDLHPHVLAMPFVLLAIGLALSLYLQGSQAIVRGTGLFKWLGAWWRGENLPFSILSIREWMRKPEFWLAAIALGGLAFLNTWDFPIYVSLFSAVYTLLKFRQEGWSANRIWDFLGLSVLLVIVGAILYLPFYIGFSSQAGGILPSLIFFTQGKYFWVFFATLIIPIIIWLLWVWWHDENKTNFLQKISNSLNGLFFGLLITFGLWFLSYLLGTLVISLPLIGNLLLQSNGVNQQTAGMAQSLISLGDLFIGSIQGASNPNALLLKSITLRLESPGTWISLLFLLSIVWALLARQKTCTKAADKIDLANHTLSANEGENSARTSPNGFVLLLILVGCGLVLIPEFIYLRDQFGWRMNTIFKFYFQTWMVWGLAAAYASAMIWSELRGMGKYLSRLFWVVIIAMGLAYPVFGILTKTNNLNPTYFTLDGTYYIERDAPDEMAAIQWLRQAPMGVVAEAVGGSYSAYARISTQTGDPTVIGWPGHESQWGRNGSMLATRENAVQTLYTTRSWPEAQKILDTYNIRYVYIGDLERGKYPVNDAKFQGHLTQVYQNNSVSIYEYLGSQNSPIGTNNQGQ